uniref:Centrosomal protein 128 n=1 Tax=Amphilophus citrinellus TaxID=61819 RepID=A0A3Q0S4L4_AMPCI
MDTSSDSDSYDRTRGHRSRGREAHRRPGRERPRANGSGGEGRTADISEKISTLADTLQDTSRNLTKVDRMLGQYREHTDDQAEAVALLRENLEESISQLQTQRLGLSNGVRSSSASTLHTSDLEAFSGSALLSRVPLVSCVLYSVWVCGCLTQIHTLHQSLRDLRCDQQRLSDDLDREILKRNRCLKSEHKSLSVRSGPMFADSCVHTCIDRSDLEKEVAELRVQLCKASVLGEVEELKRALDCKEKERVQLSLQLKVCVTGGSEKDSSFQSRGQAERRETEALLLESKRSRDELKTRAQEAVRQWRAKCRRLQKELEEARAESQFLTDKEKGNAQAQLKALSQQTEAARRELAEILGRLAQREEELHRKDVELSETHQRQLSLQEASATLEEETRRQAAIQARLKEENQMLQEQADTQARHFQRDLDTQAELQAALKQMTAAHAQLTQRLAEEETSRKELQKSTSELQVKLTALQEERTVLSKQLQLEREVHQKELDNLKATMEGSKAKKAREVQDMLQLCRQEQDEMQEKIKELKADAASDKKLCGALRIKLDRMKDECDKLAAQLSTKDEAHALLHRKYQLLKQELEDEVSLTSFGERRRVSESELVKLEEKALQMEAEQKAVLTSLGEELDAACRSLARNGEDKLQTKLRWLCEEVRERDTREQRLRRQHQQTRDQLKALRQSSNSEQKALLQRLDQQEKLLHSLSAEKKELLERGRKKEEEMRSLQVSIFICFFFFNPNLFFCYLHLLSCSLNSDSQQQREMVEERYTKYKEIVWDLQHQLDESKRRIQEYRDEKLDATSRSLKLAAFSSTIKGSDTFLSSSQRSDALCEYEADSLSVLLMLGMDFLHLCTANNLKMYSVRVFSSHPFQCYKKIIYFINYFLYSGIFVFMK